MASSLRSTLESAFSAVALAALLLPGAREAAAQAALNRCVAADGTAVFTDRACDAVDARPAAMPPSDPDDLTDGTATVRECARKPEALVEAIQQAFLAADGNRLAELYDWRGRSRASANAVMPRLETLAASRVIDVRTLHSAEGSNDAALAAEAAAAPPDRLRITHAPQGFGSGQATEFRLVRAAGCWLLAD